MAIADIQEYLKLIPAVNRAPQHAVWLTYDAEADTLYVNYKKPSHATDSEMTDDDVIVRYEGGRSYRLYGIACQQTAEQSGLVSEGMLRHMPAMYQRRLSADDNEDKAI
jgi:uncharacterized protein YuzE